MSDLKPCPFCDGALVWSDTYSEYHHPVAKCILSGHKFKKGMIGQWNRRALPAVQPDRIEQLERELSICRMAQVVMDNTVETLTDELRAARFLLKGGLGK